MRIIAMHPPRGVEMALCDVEILDGVKVFGVRVMQSSDGNHRAYAKNVTFSPAVVAAIGNELKGRLPHAHRN